MSILETISQVGENKKTLAITSILALLIIAAGVWYFIFYQPSIITYEEGNIEQTDMNYAQSELQGQTGIQNLDESYQGESTTQDTITSNMNNQDHLIQDNISSSIGAMNDMDTQGNINADNNMSSTSSAYAAVEDNRTHTQNNMITQIRYSIKPLDAKIAFCDSMRNGRWDMIKSCESNMLSSIHQLIDTNSEIVALEVIGIVDSNPYAGPSAELKQEGLASFRAREAIRAITTEFSNIAVFEGLSMQIPNKRGFEVKAYYLQK